MWIAQWLMMSYGGKKGFVPWANTLGYYPLAWDALDYSGNSRNLTTSGVSWVSDGMSMNGSATANNTSQVLSTGTSPYTIRFQVKLNAEISSWVWTLMNLNPDSTKQDTIYSLYYQYNWGTRRLQYIHYYNWPETYYELNKTISLSTTKTVITMVYTGSSMILYINGSSVVSWWGWGTFWSNAWQSYYKWLSIGSDMWAWTFANKSNAIYQNVVFENIARDSTKVSDDYNSL